MDADLIPTSWEKRGNIITVVGVGGGGNNAVSYMYKLGLKDVDFVVCNTDTQALQKSPVPTKLQIGPILTKGLGAGTDYTVGRQAAEESLEEISRLEDASARQWLTNLVNSWDDKPLTKHL